MPTTEHTINDALADLLRLTRSEWRQEEVIRSENTGTLVGSSKRPDILVLEPNVSPVVLETEVLPAITVEKEALERLGEQLKHNGSRILSSVAVRLPMRMRSKAGTSLRKALQSAEDLEWALFTGLDQSDFVRWPSSGWLQGSVAELSVLVQSASVPPTVIDTAADYLLEGISGVAGQLQQAATSSPGAVKRIAEHLCQEDGDQTLRMAGAILANAFVFHETLAGGPGKLSSVLSLAELSSTSMGLSKSAILDEWKKILKVNYWPIFDIARRILESVPSAYAKKIVEALAKTSQRLLESQLMRSHDLTGAVFQRLIADRKFLAAYYTTPASAALLSSLAIREDYPEAITNWGDASQVTSLRIADFACGTGTLLSAAYQQIGQLHEVHGGNAEKIHAPMMSKSLVGCDVLPAAAHLTASMLSGAHPRKTYTNSSILTVAYGLQDDGSVALGSLQLLEPQGTLGVLSITAKAAHGEGEQEQEIWESLPHKSFDVILMNPPFTRATGHEGNKVGVPNPMFAAFGSNAEEQKLMAQAAKRLTEGTCGHGNAGEASYFLALADKKIKLGGSLGLVMPLSLMAGDAWEASRQLLAKRYANLVLVSIAATDGGPMSFSADTGMGECLVIGKRTKGGAERATFVVLDSAPKYPLLGRAIASQIQKAIESSSLHTLEGGPLGGSPIFFGDDEIGSAIDAPLAKEGSWSIFRIRDLALAQSAFQLVKKGLVWLPSRSKPDDVSLPMVRMKKIALIGPYHADIDGNTTNKGIRGPFNRKAISSKSAPTYPALWAHDAPREYSMQFDPDTELVPKTGKNSEEQEMIADKIAQIWSSASHCHFNQNFQFNSQATAMQYTPKRCVGGRAWISLKLSSSAQEKAMTLWGNSSLGLLLHWWQANKQQSGRGNIGRNVLENLVVLDVSSLSESQLVKAEKLFDSICENQLSPIHQIHSDSTREKLDRRFLRDILGLSPDLFEEGGAMSLLRQKLSKEPSIYGHKDGEGEGDED